MLPLLILLPLLALVLVNLPIFSAAKRSAAGVVLVLFVAQAVLAAFVPMAAWAGPGLLDQFFALHLVADSLTRVLLLSIGIVGFVSVLVGWEMISEPRRLFNLVNVMLISMIGMNGVVLLTDIFSFYVFLEVTSISAFVLIAFNRDMKGIEGAFKYLILSAVATILMLSAIALFVMIAGGTSFAAIHAALTHSGGSVLAKIAIGLFLCGLFIKGGLVPFHGWLPDAYSAAPASVSVLLAGIVTKVSGIYALIRLVSSVFPGSLAIDHTLMLIGTISIVVGAFAALGQRDLKRLLAYSSISQVGYIILGLGCGTGLAFIGAVFHLFNHSIFKSLLFVNSASLEQRLGTTDMRRMGGLGARMPVTSTTNVIGALSTAGVPPFAGFWSKLIIIIALWQKDHFTYAFIAILMSVVTLGYLLTMHRRIFFGQPATEGQLAEVREAGAGLVVPAVLLAIITTGVGLAIPWVLQTFILPLKNIL